MKTHGVQLKIRALLLSAGLILPTFAFAQHDGMGQGYVFGSAGKAPYFTGAKVGGGIGFERLFHGVGAGADFQAYGTNGEEGGVVFTTNGSYHFRNLTPSRKLVPFGTFGFSALAVCSDGCGGTSGYNFGGGVNYWIKPERGLRLEVRDHVYDSSRT